MLRRVKNSINLAEQLRTLESKTRAFFKESPNLYIIRADKSNKTVIIKKEDYIDKMNNILKDRTTFKEIDYDPTNSMTTK